MAEAGLYADRLSANIELPREEALTRLAPQKDMAVIKKAMGQVRLGVEAAKPQKKDRAKPPKFAPAGQSTQLIVGADGAPDTEILDRSASLYGGYGLRRVYYSAFSPIPDSSSTLPLSKPPLMREHRLYQADWLMRFYGFSAPEIGEATTGGMLDLAVDPKLAWALNSRAQFPVDVNTADREMLLRVPGLGVKSVDRMISVRRYRTPASGGHRPPVPGHRQGAALHHGPGLVAGRTDRRRGSARATGSRARAGATEPVLMRVAQLVSETDFDGWRLAARDLRLAGIRPEDATFRVAGAEGQGGLFDTPTEDRSPVRDERKEEGFSVPKAFVDVAREVILHRSADRFDLLYRILWRLRDEPDLMKVVSDRDIVDALDRVRNVSRASHKMKAFVRFRFVEDENGETAVAWFEPAHRVLEKTAPFFVNRFTTMRWSILTPDGSAFWDGASLAFGPPASAADAPDEDAVEEFLEDLLCLDLQPGAAEDKGPCRARCPSGTGRTCPRRR